ncbi:MAG: HAD family hydrolase, partial [Candidatus Entotheonellia bacterium]
FENHPWEELLRQGVDAVHAELGARGAVLPARQEFHRQFHETYSASWKQSEESSLEMEIRVLLAGMAQLLGVSLSEEDVADLVRVHYRPISAQVTIYADTVDTLTHLRARGLKLGLISNTVWPGYLHHEDLQRFGIIHFFDHLLFSSDIGVRKPHPRIFQTALTSLGVAPSEAVFVGDRFREDVGGPQRLGMLSVWKERPERERDPQIVPDGQILQLLELLPLLDRWMERNVA